MFYIFSITIIQYLYLLSLDEPDHEGDGKLSSDEDVDTAHDDGAPDLGSEIVPLCNQPCCSGSEISQPANPIILKKTKRPL